MGQNTKSFRENLSIICDELRLARRWGKASIILTIHRSVFSQDKTKKALSKKLGGMDYHVVEILVNEVEGNFIEYMLKHKNVKNLVFFISNIGWGGGEDEKDGYRFLNLYRETIVEQELKVVFFLTLNEAASLPEHAPDFWAFRHRVLEFGSPRTYKQKRPPVGLMLWHMENSFTPAKDVKSRISNQMKMLTDINDQAESVSLRIDLQYELGFLYWLLGDYLNAEKTLSEGIELAKTYELADSLVRLKNGLAILCYELENYQRAMDLLEPVIEENPRDCLILLNRAIILFAMKKRYRAIIKGKKAASRCAQNFRVWNSLGYLYYYTGKMDEAETCFQTAIDISPKFDYLYESLAICYLTIGLSDKANAQLDQANKFLSNREIFQAVLRDFIAGNTEKVPRLIDTAIEAGIITKFDIGRDPTLYALFDSDEIEKI
jgi:hypothetical protein